MKIIVQRPKQPSTIRGTLSWCVLRKVRMIDRYEIRRDTMQLITCGRLYSTPRTVQLADLYPASSSRL